MEGKIYSPEKGKFVSVKTKHGQKVLKIYNEHLLGGDKHHNCAYCKIVNPKTGKMVSTYGQTGGRVIKSYVEQEGGATEIYYGKKGNDTSQSPGPSPSSSPGPSPTPGPSPSSSPGPSPTPGPSPSSSPGPSPSPTPGPSPSPTPGPSPSPTPSLPLPPIPEPEPSNLKDYPIIIDGTPDHVSIATYNFFNREELTVTGHDTKKNKITINHKLFENRYSCILGEGSYGYVCPYTYYERDKVQMEIVIKFRKRYNEKNYNKIASEYINDNSLKNLKNKQYIVPHIRYNNMIIMPKIQILKSIIYSSNPIWTKFKERKIKLIILYNIIRSIHELVCNKLFYTDIKLDNVGIMNIKDNEYKCFLIDLGSISKIGNDTISAISYLAYRTPYNQKELKMKLYFIYKSINIKIINMMFREDDKKLLRLASFNKHYIIYYLEELRYIIDCQ